MAMSFRATAPLDMEAALPIALLRQHLKVEPDEEPLLVSAARSGALGWIEKRVGQSLSRRGWIATFDASADDLRLPMGPVAEVTAFQYRDGANQLQAWGASNYRVAGDLVAPVCSRPAARGQMAFTIAYLAGFEDLGTEAPALRSAALMLAGHMFRNREENTAVVMASIPFGVGMLIEDARMPVIG